MRAKPEIEKEATKWDGMPFSFSPSAELLALFKRRKAAYDARHRKAPERRACMCQNCGSVIVVGRARSYRENAQPEVYCDKECSYADRSRVYQMRRIADKTTLSKGLIPKSMASKVVFCSCGHCHRRFATAEQKQFCSDECTQSHRERLKEANRLQWAIERIERQKKNAKLQSCKHCGTQYTSLREGGKLYCSQRCVSKMARRRREHIKRTSVSFGGCFSAREVFDAAKWKCKQCKCKVQPPDGTYNETEATMDHIVPVSKGGLHVWSNVQCLCRACNSAKSDKLAKPMQLTFL